MARFNSIPVTDKLKAIRIIKLGDVYYLEMEGEKYKFNENIPELFKKKVSALGFAFGDDISKGIVEKEWKLDKASNESELPNSVIFEAKLS